MSIGLYYDKFCFHLAIGQQKMNEMLKNESQKHSNGYNHNHQSQNGTLSGFATKFLKNLQTEFEKANKFKP